MFGNGLWSTADGGEHWAQALSHGGSIVSLEVIDGQVLAITAACTPPAACPQTGFLVRRPLAGGAWQTVAQVSLPDAMATQARVAAVLAGDAVIATSDGGISTVDHSGPCNTTAIEPPASIAVTGPTGLVVLCAGNGAAGSEEKTVWVSDDLGARWTKAGSPDRGGITEGISAGSASQLVVAAASGASTLPAVSDDNTESRPGWLLLTSNGGASWQPASF